MKPEHGGCFGRQPGTGHRCVCSEFVEATEAEPAKPPSVPPALRVVELPESLQPLREATTAELDTHAKRRTFDPGRLVGAERNAPAATSDSPLKRGPLVEGHTMIDPSMKLSIAGKPREMTELHAAANAIIAETNAEDLATGVHEMRQTIRRQATALAEVRAELEVKEKQLLEQASFQNAIALALGVPYTTARGATLRAAVDLIQAAKLGASQSAVIAPTNVTVKIDVHGDFSAAALAAALQEAAAKVLS